MTTPTQVATLKEALEFFIEVVNPPYPQSMAIWNEHLKAATIKAQAALTAAAEVGGGPSNPFVSYAKPAAEVEGEETAPELLQRLGADASKWAAEFNKTAIKLGYSDMDEGWLVGWFANAIENAEMIRHPAALTAAAEVGEPLINQAKKESVENMTWWEGYRTAIEHCAQKLEEAYAECDTLNLLHGAARLRAMKDEA